MNWKECGKKRPSTYVRYITVFTWRDWRRPRKPLVIVSVPDEIWIGHLSYKIQKCSGSYTCREFWWASLLGDGNLDVREVMEGDEGRKDGSFSGSCPMADGLWCAPVTTKMSLTEDATWWRMSWHAGLESESFTLIYRNAGIICNGVFNVYSAKSQGKPYNGRQINCRSFSSSYAINCMLLFPCWVDGWGPDIVY
jgi:hypothetical protein